VSNGQRSFFVIFFTNSKIMESMIERAEEFFYYEDDLTAKIQSWAEPRCETFIGKDSKAYEHPQSHMQLFQEYCEIFESILTEFLQINNMSVNEFYREVRMEYEKAMASTGKSGASSTFAAVLMASVDFHVFCEMMNDVREGRGVVFCPPLVDMETPSVAKELRENSKEEDFHSDSKSYSEDDIGAKDQTYKRSSYK
jgi:hypothetical protein